jgi:hypothetical protein
MKHLTINQFENDSFYNINTRAGIPYYICNLCQYKYYNNIYTCRCGGTLKIKSGAQLYKSCGCPHGYSMITTTICRLKESTTSSNQAKSFNLEAYCNKHNIKRWMYLKTGAKTKFNFDVLNYNNITGGNIFHNQLGIYVPSYSLYFPKKNEKMTVNNIPCKLLYTEYSKSSRSPTHGYHITYIIALDYNIMNEHIKHCKLLIELNSDKRSLLSTLPKEIISIIKKFIMHKYASVYSCS